MDTGLCASVKALARILVASGVRLSVGELGELDAVTAAVEGSGRWTLH